MPRPKKKPRYEGPFPVPPNPGEFGSFGRRYWLPGVAYTTGAKRQVHLAWLYAKQAGRCAICGLELPPEAFHIDHCHQTGFIRGLLCRACNTGLGFFKDDPALMKRAASYLESASMRFDRIVNSDLEES